MRRFMMARAFDDLLDQYDRGQLNRRQLLKGLALATSGAIAGTAGLEAEGAAIAPAATINHMHIEVANLKKAVEWYAAVLGCTPVTQRPQAGMTTMNLPGTSSTRGQWLSISEAGPSHPKRVGYDEKGDKAGE